MKEVEGVFADEGAKGCVGKDTEGGGGGTEGNTTPSGMFKGGRMLPKFKLGILGVAKVGGGGGAGGGANTTDTTSH